MRRGIVEVLDLVEQRDAGDLGDARDRAPDHQHDLSLIHICIGLAIFSRTPLFETFRLDVPSPAIEFEFNGRKTTPTDRLMIGAKTVVDGRQVQLYNVHLLAFFMLGSSSTNFPWQRDLVADRLAVSDSPTILGGDFNVSQHASLVEQFAEFGYATVQHKLPTWHRRPYVLDLSLIHI